SKANCPDVRNTRAVDIFNESINFGLRVDIYDPGADIAEGEHEYGGKVLTQLDEKTAYDAIVVAVAHTELLRLDYQKIKRNNGVIFDTKGYLDRTIVDGRL